MEPRLKVRFETALGERTPPLSKTRSITWCIYSKAKDKKPPNNTGNDVYN